MWHHLHDWLLMMDHRIWNAINVRGQNEFFNTVLPYVRNENFWAPLYLFLLVYGTVNFKKAGWVWCLLFLVAFAMSDFINSSLLKPFFNRTRPCNSMDLAQIIHLIVPCGSGQSFPSSHAANHFAMGSFAALTLRRHTKWIWTIFIVWAVIVSYAQVYVGVHYPADVTAGALLGMLIGWGCAKLFHLKFELRHEPVPAEGT